MKKSNQNKKAVKALAVSMFAVGFVTPLMFSNIAEAANFGKGGTVAITTDAEINAGNGTKWAKRNDSSNINGSNSVAIFDKNGGTHLFKIVAASGSGTDAVLTLWSYDYSFGSAKFNDSVDGGNVYAGSELQKKTDALYDSSVCPTYEKAGILSDLSLVQLTTSIGSDPAITEKYIWIPSKTEVEGWTDSGTDGEKQRDICNYSWLRSSDPDYAPNAYDVSPVGGLETNCVVNGFILRPALQILNQTSCVFTTNVTIPTTGVFTADGSGTPTSYALNSSVTKHTFTPTSGVTLDGTKIGVRTGAVIGTGYETTGLLTTNSGATWEAINTGDNANIAYMAQVDNSDINNSKLDLKNVTAGTDYNLKIFGLNTADNMVTELADNAVQGLSKGSDSKIHMVVSGTVNAGVPVTVSNGAVVDFGGGDLTAKLDFKSGGNLAVTGQLNFGTNGVVKQAAGSNITVPASKIQADSNDSNQAMFTGVNDAGKLDVDDGNLTLSGTVQEGQYYVLAAGSAVDAGFVTSNLWKPGNIFFSDMVIAEFEYDTVASSSVALKVTNAVNLQEGNTSGLAAVQQGNISVAKEFTDEVANRLSFVQRPSLLQKMQAKVRDVANTNKDDYKVETVEQGNANEVMPVQVADEDKYDKEVWASYIRTKETTEGMKLGAGLEGNNTAQYNGAVVGVDFYSSDKAIAGVAFSYTTGDIDSYSGETATRNKSKYYGISFYDRVTNGNNAIIYDIGFIEGDNDISQFYTGKETTADVKTDTYTAGVRYEAEFGTKESRVVPFASFRYMRQNNKDYTNSHGTRFESNNQNLYIPKVGIAWTGDFTAPNSVCTWRPHVEAGYVWNLGDRSVDSNVLMGTTIAGVEYDTVDKSSYYAKAGMEFSCKNFTAGLFYRYLKGSAVRNNKWNVNVSWAF